MTLFKRPLFHRIISQINNSEFVIIVGARQTGKTTILKQIAKYFSLKAEKYAEISLEDFSILSKLNEHPENIFSYLSKPKKDEKAYILIDEVQYLENPSNFLKYLFDKYSENIKIIATGSSAFYIDTKFKDSLAGRKQLFELGTLDFNEFLHFKTGIQKFTDEMQEIRTNPGYLSIYRKEIANYFSEYLIFGGYPGVVLANSPEKKILLLRELLNSYIKRDIAEANIHYQEKFFYLMKILAEQTGNLLNINELSLTLGLSVTTINNYIYILQKCFHIRLLKPFFRNLRKELTKMPKVYFNDLGLRNALLNQFAPIEDHLDKGAIIENYLYLRLNQIQTTDNLRYWRTADGKEVDFVVLNGPENGFAIECKFQHSGFRASKYSAFTNAYPNIPLHCRSYDDQNNENWVLSL